MTYLPDKTLLTTGEATMPRRTVSSQPGMTNGSMRLTYFPAVKSETITQVRTAPAGTPQVGATLCRIGVWEVDLSTGNLAPVASTVNDTTLWVAANTDYDKAFSSSFAKKRGTWYAVGVLLVGASQTPLFTGQGSITPLRSAGAPRLSGFISGLTDLPSGTISAGTISNSAQQIYSELLP
jgi:hypothetical protein